MAETTRIPYLAEMLAALSQPGCAFCRLLDATAGRLVDAILFESVNDVGVREELNAARGFCRRHAALLVRTGGALGTATMMQGVIKVLLRELDGSGTEVGPPGRLRALLRAGGVGGPDPAAARLADALAPRAPCPVCAHEATFTEHYIDTLLKQATPGSPLAGAYAASDGLCLLHFRAVVARGQSGPALMTLVAAQRAHWQRLDGELEEFLRKSDYRFQHEKFGAERDAWQRALSAVSGQLPGHLTEGA
ncbi:MAG TPA: DUF6062 family protein [Promineifilum sp.]|nr:DUF6062 family protein [Promineifilum sp.]